MNYFRTTNKILGTGLLLDALSILAGILVIVGTMIL